MLRAGCPPEEFSIRLLSRFYRVLQRHRADNEELCYQSVSKAIEYIYEAAMERVLPFKSDV